MLTSFHVPFENLATCSSKTYVLELYDTVYDKATNPPSVIHGWKATDLLYEMVRRKNYWRNPISRQNFANALAVNHNLKLEVCLRFPEGALLAARWPFDRPDCPK